MCSYFLRTAPAEDSMQGLSYTNVSTATPPCGTHWYCKNCRVNGATGLPNGIIWPSTTMNAWNAQNDMYLFPNIYTYNFET